MSESVRTDAVVLVSSFEVRSFVSVRMCRVGQNERIRILVQPRNAEQEGTYQMPFLFFNAELLLYGPSCMVVMALVLVRCACEVGACGLAVVIAPHRKILLIGISLGSLPACPSVINNKSSPSHGSLSINNCP